MKKLGSHSELNSPLLRVSSSGCPDSAFETLFRSAVERVSCGVHPTTLHSCCSCAGYMTLSSVFAAWSAWDEFFVGSRSLSTRRERERERGEEREREENTLLHKETDRQTDLSSAKTCFCRRCHRSSCFRRWCSTDKRQNSTAAYGAGTSFTDGMFVTCSGCVATEGIAKVGVLFPK